MILTDAIPGLVTLLQNRGAFLWHACQFRDFQSYLALGGIPSRSRLEASGSAFTAFETDSQDHDKGVWEKVFVNLSDFGRSFAVGGNAVPNPYGPIVLKVRPRALLEATDVAICLRSAGGRQFDRDNEALKSIEAIDFLFEHPVEAGFPQSSYVKFKERLRVKYPTAEEPEVSCTVPGGQLSIQHVETALVDPYTFPDKRLLAIAEEVRVHHKARFRVQERRCKNASRPPLYDELASVIVDGVPALNNLANNEALSGELRTWCQSIMKLEWQFRRFAQYLRNGTLLPILKPNDETKSASSQGMAVRAKK